MSYSKIVIDSTEGELSIEQSSRNFPPIITFRKFGYVDSGRVWDETDAYGEPNPRAGQPIQERQCVEEFTHRLGAQTVRELIKALQYYS